MSTRLSKSREVQLVALALAVLMATSAAFPAAAGGAGTAGAPDDAIEDRSVFDRAEAVSTHAAEVSTGTSSGQFDDDRASTGDAPVDENVTGAEGSVEVIVSVEAIDLPLLAQGTDAVDRLKAQAEESQKPIVEYAAKTEGIEVLNRFWITNAVLLEVDVSTVDVDDLAAVDGIERIDRNYEVRAPEPIETDGVESADDAETTYGLDQINATEVWDAYDTMGEGAKIAVLDTGVDPDHPDIDIAEENWAEFDGDGNVVDSEPHETQYHGTHTSGTVVGGNASGQYIGVAPEATLMHGLVIPTGSGSIAQIIGGIEWAVEEDADAVSMSLGAEDYVPDFIEVHQNARAAGTVIVASSGNGGDGSSSSPGNDYESIAVGASDENADIASFSSGEKIDTSLEWGESAPDYWPEEYIVPDVAAPGVSVTSAEPGDSYQELSGTSMAAPHVAGTIGLMVAADDDAPAIDDIETALGASAWKPDDADAPEDEPDTRYGHGIINAKIATDRVAADQGVTGTVTDAGGDPIANATVSLGSGFTTTTDENGEYEIGGAEDMMHVTAEKFGYESKSATVDIGDEYVTQNFQLRNVVDVNAGETPSGVIAGENTTVEFETANVDSLTVDISGDLNESEATLYVDGETVDFGETYESDTLEGETVANVSVPNNASGNFSLAFGFEGLGGETVTYDLEDLRIFEDSFDVGIVSPGSEYAVQLGNDLRKQLPVNYEITLVPNDQVMNVTDDYDTFVVQNFGDSAGADRDGVNPELAEKFYEATDDPSTGVVYLDQYQDSDSLHELSRGTGDPARTDSMLFIQHDPVPDEWDVGYHVRENHSIFDGIADEGDEVRLYKPGHTGEFAWFEGYTGDVIADVGYEGYEPRGHGMGVDDLRGNVLAASLGYSIMFGGGGFTDYTDTAKQILANSIEYVSGDEPMSIAEDQPDRTSPGEPITVEFDVEDLERISVGLNEELSTVSEDDLTLYVDGAVNAFDAYRGYDGKTGTVNVTVVPDEPIQGKVALEHTLVSEDGERQSGGTGPTSMYDAPIEVPYDVDTIQDAIDLAISDEEIVVDNGTYTEQISVRDGGKENLTIRAADGATPRLELPDDPAERIAFNINTEDQKPVVYVRYVDNVTISGFEIDAGGEVGLFPTQALDGTFSNLHVSNASTAIWPDLDSYRTVIENSTITDSDRGIFAQTRNDNSLIRDNEISDVEIGVETDHVIDEVDVIGNEVTNASYAGYLINGGDGHVDDNVARNATRGLYLSTSGDVASLDDNVVEGATWGLVEASVNVPGVMTGNAFEAETAVSHSGWAGPPAFHFNDFSGSDLVHDTPIHIDSQLNYVGERPGAEPIDDGPVSYEPFLTDAPENVDGWNTSKIGVDVTLEAGDTYAVGVPGPTNQTVGEIVDDAADATVYTFDADTQGWQRLSDDDHVDALEALVVDAETDVRLTFEFRTDGASEPGEMELEKGWNFVTAPTYGDAESVFGNGSFDPQLLRSSFGNGAPGSAPGNGPGANGPAKSGPPPLPLEQPTDQLGPAGEVDEQYVFDGDATDAPDVSAFEGYFVLATDDGTLSTSLASNPDAETLYEDLGLEAPDAIEGQAAADAATVEDVLEADVDDEAVHDALVAVVTDELREELEALPADATSAERLEAVSAAADAVVADAPDDHADPVGEATEDAVEQVVTVEFGANIAHHGVWEYENDGTAESVDADSVAAPAGA